MATSNDLFGALLELQWRGIGVPYSETELDLRQDLVIHKFGDRDGGHVEGTGRAPLQITARLPLFNGLTPAPSETWNAGAMYPVLWRKFFAACADKTSGTLQHPELGSITCKCETAKTRWGADARSGVWVSVTWIESDDTGIDLDQDLSNPSPEAQVSISASDLDAQFASINPALVPTLPTFPFSFTDLANAIRSVIDQTTILEKTAQGRLDNLLYQANQFETSLSLAANASPTNWPMFQSCERAKSAAYALKAQPQTPSRPVLVKTTQKDATLAQVAAQVGASVADIIALNSGLVGPLFVPRGTPVQYYAKAA